MSTSLRQARDVLNLGVWEIGNVFYRRLGGGLYLCLADHPSRTGHMLLVTTLSTFQDLWNSRNDPLMSRVCLNLHRWDYLNQSHVCESLVGRLLPCLLTSSCRRSFCAAFVFAWTQGLIIGAEQRANGWRDTSPAPIK